MSGIEITRRPRVIEVVLSKRTITNADPLPKSRVANAALLSSDDKGTSNNTGAVAPVTLQLPPSSSVWVGWSHTFHVTAGLLLSVAAQGSDTIRFDNIETDPAGFLRKSEVGGVLVIRLAAPGKYWATFWIGDWSNG